MQSEAINELIAALAKAQGEMKPAAKDSTNPHFRSRYADLASVWDACRDALASNGLAVTQCVQNEGEKQVLVTTLGHSSGQWMKSFMTLPIQKAGAQELGSCISYCRRYSLASMVGVYQDDDDGERAEQAKEIPKYLSKDMIAALNPLMAEDLEAVELIKGKYKCNWTYLPIEKFGEVMSWMKDRKAKREKSKEEVDD